MKTIVKDKNGTTLYTSRAVGYQGHKEAIAWCKRAGLSAFNVWLDEVPAAEAAR